MFFIRSIHARRCFAALLFPLTVAAHGADRGSLDIDRAVGLALKGNPGLSEIDARAKALAQVPDQVGTLPDPTLSLGAVSLPTDTFSTTQEAMTQMQVGIGVTLPFPGKLGLRKEAAEFEARAAKFDVNEARLVLVKSVRSTWWNIFFLDRATDIVKRNQDLLRGLVKIAETKYKTGKGLQSDVLLAQTELSKLLDAGISIESSRRGQTAALNALLGRSISTPVILPDQATLALPSVPGEASLFRIALDDSPALSSIRAEIKAARTKVALAEKDYYPDFRLGTAYGFRSGYNANGSPRADLASVTISMNLPIFTDTKQDRALDQRKAEALKAQYALQDNIEQVDAQIDASLSDFKANRERAMLYKTGIIPQANQTAASMLSAYQVDKADFLNLVRAQVTLYNYETQYWKALSSAWQAWAKLQAAIGVPVQNAMEKNHE